MYVACAFVFKMLKTRYAVASIAILVIVGLYLEEILLSRYVFKTTERKENEVERGITFPVQAASESSFSHDPHSPPLSLSTAASKKNLTCEPALSIVYVKKHKVGSTSLGQTIGSFTWKHTNRRPINDATRALGVPFPFLGGYPGRFKRKFACHQGSRLCEPEKKSSQTGPVQILSGHLIFNYEEIKPLVDPKSRYITMMRHPYTQFESAFHYYYRQHSHLPRHLSSVVCHPEPYLRIAGRFRMNYQEYLKIANEKTVNGSVPYFFRTRNHQSFELGLDPFNEDEAYIREQAKKLDSVFDLILITEYYVESLVLLKEVLCMDWDDLVLKREVSGRYKKLALTEEEEKTVRSLNKQDLILYDHFNKSFWKKVEAYGRERMARDVKRVLEMNSKKQDEAKKAAEPSPVKKPPKPAPGDKPPGGKSRPKRDTLNVAHASLRDQRIANLTERIQPSKAQSQNVELNAEVVREVAEYMHDNYGWCTY